MVETGLLSETVINHDDRKKTNLIRVLIVDDHQVVREGLRRILELEEDIRIVGEAATGDEAIAKTVAFSPDVVTMDLKMPGMDGIIATREIKQKVPDVDVLMLTLYAEDFVKEAISAGASGYLLKDSDCDQIVKAIHQVHNGLCPIAPSLTKELVTDFARLSKQSPRRPAATMAAMTTILFSRPARLPSSPDEHRRRLPTSPVLPEPGAIDIVADEFLGNSLDTTPPAITATTPSVVAASGTATPFRSVPVDSERAAQPDRRQRPGGFPTAGSPGPGAFGGLGDTVYTLVPQYTPGSTTLT